MSQVIASYNIGNSKGVHGRVATKLAEIALEFDVEVLIEHNGSQVSCDSILDVLSMALVHGSEVQVILSGEKARSALVEIGAVLTAENDP
ncbi:HPr family phosphocarrier protein [Desulfogranum marinum]|uniref:HPr family phosphocarrier protein n=1 Tax=Desulfogranum marinum TaxID=453220 RepID=UPI0029C67897|nr:HPr family phosphocarrier protein [Desulfogranum marinum]